MTVLQFIASLVNSLAWPLAVILIALIFRAQIRSLASRPMRKLRAGPLEVEFDRIGAEVEAVVGRPTLSICEAGKEQGASVIEELSGLAEASPVAAVMDAHAAIEQEIRNIVLGVDPQADVSKMAMGQLIRLALDKGTITPETAKAVEGITVMRNLAAHGRASEVTVERARDYLALADAVLYTLR
ncbi:hypothetical protein [Ferrimicrobium sp.]|uniref:hypothetical protein n=1 Tax=Ferrimicrobium sp. TaxID=2926050 RepID=UPI002617C6D6|nr:hypothetical protein [Ferrimicrobium sp.]